MGVTFANPILFHYKTSGLESNRSFSVKTGITANAHGLMSTDALVTTTFQFWSQNATDVSKLCVCLNQAFLEYLSSLMDFKPRVCYLESQSFICFISKPSRRSLVPEPSRCSLAEVSDDFKFQSQVYVL